MSEFRNNKVLLIDDEAAIRKTFEALLSREGYEIYSTGDGLEGLKLLKEKQPDVVLLDVMMPGMDGFEVCRRIRSGSVAERKTPVIMVTALDTRDDLIRGLEAGADEFLSKPVNGPELRARVRSMLRIKQLFDMLEESMKMREDLTDLIVHDMRNPLSIVLMYCNLLKSFTDPPPNLDEYIDKILKQSRRLESFLNDLLIQAKMEQNKLILKKEFVDLYELAREAERNHRDLAGAKKLDIKLDIPTGKLVLELDANLIRRVFDNLLSNAIKFSPSQSSIGVKVEQPNVNWDAKQLTPTVIIRVTDEGPGISAQDKDKVFNKFSVVDMKKRGINQVGLGLTFCKLAVEAHNGKIYASDNTPKGTVFTVEL